MWRRRESRGGMGGSGANPACSPRITARVAGEGIQAWVGHGFSCRVQGWQGWRPYILPEPATRDIRTSPLVRTDRHGTPPASRLRGYPGQLVVRVAQRQEASERAPLYE